MNENIFSVLTESDLTALIFSSFLMGFIPIGWAMLNEILHDKGLSLFLIPAALALIGLGIMGILSLILIPLKYFMGC